MTRPTSSRSQICRTAICVGIWQCFGCGAKGNVIEFATRMEGFNPENPDDFRKTALLLQKMFVGKDGEERGKPRTEVMRERSGQEDREEERPDSVVNAPLDFKLQRLDYSHPYLRERGFTEETVKAVLDTVSAGS